MDPSITSGVDSGRFSEILPIVLHSTRARFDGEERSQDEPISDSDLFLDDDAEFSMPFDKGYEAAANIDQEKTTKKKMSGEKTAMKKTIEDDGETSEDVTIGKLQRDTKTYI